MVLLCLLSGNRFWLPFYSTFRFYSHSKYTFRIVTPEKAENVRFISVYRNIPVASTVQIARKFHLWTTLYNGKPLGACECFWWLTKPKATRRLFLHLVSVGKPKAFSEALTKCTTHTCNVYWIEYVYQIATKLGYHVWRRGDVGWYGWIAPELNFWLSI